MRAEEMLNYRSFGRRKKLTSATGFTEIDHVVCRVQDLDAAVGKFRRMGFRLTPESSFMHVTNRLIQLTPVAPDAPNFFEFLTISDTRKVDSIVKANLTGPDGLVMLVHITDDVSRAHATLASVGAPGGSIVEIERDWIEADGFNECVKYEALIPEPGELPFLVNAYCPSDVGQYTQARYQQHANGAVRMTRIIACVEDIELQDAVAKFETIYDTKAINVAEGIIDVTPRDVSLRFITPGKLLSTYIDIDYWRDKPPPSLVGLVIEVRDLDVLRSILKTNDVLHHDVGDTIIVPPEESCGFLLEFHTSLRDT